MILNIFIIILYFLTSLIIMNDDIRIPTSYYGDSIYKEYVKDYLKWENDGKRFINEEFINEYLENGSFPKLNDGRPELDQWLGYTNVGYVFRSCGWAFTIRMEMAKPFIQKMYDLYQENQIEPKYIRELRQSLVYLIPEDEY